MKLEDVQKQVMKWYPEKSVCISVELWHFHHGNGNHRQELEYRIHINTSPVINERAATIGDCLAKVKPSTASLEDQLEEANSLLGLQKEEE